MLLGISSNVSEDLNVDAVMGHAAQAMHQANDLVPPLMESWAPGCFFEYHWRGNTPLEAAQLLEEGLLDIREEGGCPYSHSAEYSSAQAPTCRYL